MQMRPAAHLRTLRSVRLGTGRRALVQERRACYLVFCFDSWLRFLDKR